MFNCISVTLYGIDSKEEKMYHLAPNFSQPSHLVPTLVTLLTENMLKVP